MGGPSKAGPSSRTSTPSRIRPGEGRRPDARPEKPAETPPADSFEPSHELQEEVAKPAGPIGRESHTSPDGSTVTSESYQSPAGDFSASYISKESPDGTVDRSYTSTEVATYESFDGELKETLTNSVVSNEQPDGSTHTYATLELDYGNQVLNVDSRRENSRVQQTHDGKTYEFEAPSAELDVPDISSSPFSEKVTTQTRPDGSTVTSTDFHDAISGYRSQEEVVVGADGSDLSRTVTSSRPSPEEDPRGLSLLEKFGHDSAQTMFDENIDGQPYSFEKGKIQADEYGPDGEVVKSGEVNAATWKRLDGSATLTHIDRGDGYANEYVLTKNEDGRISTQHFVEGSQDTRLTHEYVDENGFRTVETESHTPDAANSAAKNGKSVPTSTYGSSKVKDEANLADLKERLGPEFDRMMESNPEFREVVERVGEQKFRLVDMESETVFGHGEDEHGLSARALGLDLPDQERVTFSMADDGEWSLSKAPEQSDKTGGGHRFTQVKNAVGLSDEVAAVARLQGHTRLARATAHGGALGPATDGLTLIADTATALQATLAGDWKQALSKGGSATEALGNLAPEFRAAAALKNLKLRTLAYSGRGLGVLGAAGNAFNGMLQLSGGDPRGAFDLVAGSSGAAGLSGLVGAGTAGIGTILGVGGGMIYDYIDGTDVAEQLI